MKLNEIPHFGFWWTARGMDFDLANFFEPNLLFFQIIYLYRWANNLVYNEPKSTREAS